MSKFKSKLNRIINFLNKDIWLIEPRNYPYKGWYFNLLRVLIVAVKGFTEDNCAVRAASLTYYSLLSIVPVLGLAFGIAKGFGFESDLKQVLSDNLQIMEQQVLDDPEESEQGVTEEEETFLDRLQIMADGIIENTKGGLVAGTGLVFLFYIIIQLLHNVEDALNQIWNIKKHRPLIRKISDYVTITLLGPILIFLSSSITIFIRSQIQSLAKDAQLTDLVDPVLTVVLQFVPYTLIWILLTLTYLILPNTKVSFRSAVIAGILAGTLYQLIQWGYITFQVGVARYGAIYGTFAAVPLFMIWLQVSWLIFLYGAEISYAIQNTRGFKAKREHPELDSYHKKLVCLMLTYDIVKRFENGEIAGSAEDFSTRLHIPLYYTKSMLYLLQQQKIINELMEGNEIRYQPARDINKFSLAFLIEQVESYGEKEIPAMDSPLKKKLIHALDHFQGLIEKSEKNILIKDIQITN
ncbi:MAG: YihY/virulence factor BrkB family protein [Cyclobacteriaceae bacterium]